MNIIKVKNISLEASFIERISKHSISNDEYMIGTGGGKHIVYNQWTSDKLPQKDTNEYHEFLDLQPLIQTMLQTFKMFYPDYKTEGNYFYYQTEHRLYIMDEEIFEGEIHNDSCDYTIICYYKIGDKIRGGTLILYEEDECTIKEKYQPQQGDIVMFSGTHSVGNLYADYQGDDNEKQEKTNSINTKDNLGNNHRAIFTIFINGGP